VTRRWTRSKRKLYIADPAVRLDLNIPAFQESFFGLPKPEIGVVAATFRKLLKMTWGQVYRDSGLRWEEIKSMRGPSDAKRYSFRVSQSFRAIGYRDGDWLRVLALYADHDAAYGKK
jgi:hypothetical protein